LISTGIMYGLKPVPFKTVGFVIKNSANPVGFALFHFHL